MAALTGAAALGAEAVACICKGKKRKRKANKVCKIYIVLHGNGVRATSVLNEGQVGSDGEPNFFRLGEGLDPSANDIKLFRMVAPGMVFMSHIDINKELRDTLLIHPLDKWLETIKHHCELTPQQIAAASHQDKVDPEGEKNIKSRAIFSQLLQLFIKNDILINERVMTDLGKKGGSTGEHLDEFGVWIHRDGENEWNKIMDSTDTFLTPTGAEEEVTLKNLISHIVTLQGDNCTDYEFYIANCSPIPTDKRSSIQRLQRTSTVGPSTVRTWRRPGQYSAVTFDDDPQNINFWLNTLYIHYERLKRYHEGKEHLNELMASSEATASAAKRCRTGEQQTEKPQVPPTDTIWGMMDSEERQDHYKLINGLLRMYPYFLREVGQRDGDETEGVVLEKKKRIKDMIIFIIKTITTPFNEQIRGGQPHEKGASQVTKYSGVIENEDGSGGASKVDPDQEGYYTLSQGVASKIAAVIRAPGRPAEIDQEILPDYKEMLQSVYGMGQGEIKDYISPNYPFKPDSVSTVGEWKTLLASQGGGNKLRKKKSRKKRRKKTRRKKKKKRKNKTRKKKRRRKKRTKRKK